MTPVEARTLFLPLFFDRRKKLSDVQYLVHCPAHEDKRPSCSVRKKKGQWRWRCFSCAASGDVLDLVMLREQLNVPAALAWLVLNYGEQSVPPPEPERKSPFVLVCWAPGCGATCDIGPKTYRTPGRGGYEWRSTAELEALTAPGWEVAPDLIAALCWRHT